jgi:hypothetical protein
MLTNQGHDGDHQFVRFVRPIKHSPFGFAESLGAAFAPVAALFLTVDHDVAPARSAVGPATLIVANLTCGSIGASFSSC